MGGQTTGSQGTPKGAATKDVQPQVKEWKKKESEDESKEEDEDGSGSGDGSNS